MRCVSLHLNDRIIFNLIPRYAVRIKAKFGRCEASDEFTEDAEDYKAFEAAIIADYDAQSAVERELVLRLASLLWRLRRATTIETGLFEIEAEHLSEAGRSHQVSPNSREFVRALFGPRASSSSPDSLPACGVKVEPSVDPAAELTGCYLRLANLPNFALDRLSRYEATLWRQVAQILFALDHLDRRNPLERRRLRCVNRQQELPA